MLGWIGSCGLGRALLGWAEQGKLWFAALQCSMVLRAASRLYQMVQVFRTPTVPRPSQHHKQKYCTKCMLPPTVAFVRSLRLQVAALSQEELLSGFRALQELALASYISEGDGRTDDTAAGDQKAKGKIDDEMEDFLLQQVGLWIQSAGACGLFNRAMHTLWLCICIWRTMRELHAKHSSGIVGLGQGLS